MFHLVVFDLDGTLIDSIGDLHTAVNQVMGEHGGRVLDLDEVARMVGEGARLLVSRAVSASGARVTVDAALARFLAVYDSLLPGETRPYAGIPELLAAAAPLAQLSVLTNKPTDATRKILESLRLARWFSGIIGGDGPFPRKPEPASLLHLAREAGVTPATTLMVGDSTVDLLTAQNAGTSMCVARYGFGQLTFDAGELRGGEFFADSPGAILDVIRRPRTRD
jgi:phosphoglycolate phosphatase